MKNILVPTDFSECANDALEFAANLTQKTGGRLHLVHALNMPSWSAGISDSIGLGYEGASSPDIPETEFFINQAEEKVQELLNKDFLQDCEVTSHVEIGGILKIILKQAERNHTDLIIMGSHGNTGMEEVLIGSNAERVVQNARIPVLTVKHKFNELDIKKIVFASDFKNEAHGAFDKVKNFADIFNAEIHLLKINTPAHFMSTAESMDQLQSFSEQEALDTIKGDHFQMAVYSDYNEELGILNYGVENRIDIVALATHRRKGLSKLFNESISQDLVNHSFRPVMTINV